MCRLTIYLPSVHLPVYHEVRLEEDVAHEEPARFLVGVRYGLPHHAERHQHDEQDHDEVQHVVHLKITIMMITMMMMTNDNDYNDNDDDDSTVKLK